MRKSIAFLCLLVLIFTTSECFSQSFKWMQTYGLVNRSIHITAVSGTPRETATYNIGISAQKTIDSISFGKFKFIISGLERAFFLVEVDSTDQVLRVKKYGNPSGTTALYHDSKENIYVIGACQSSETFFGQSIDTDSGSTWVAKLDSAWNLKWFKQMGSSAYVLYPRFRISDKDRFFFILGGRRDTKVGDTTHYLKEIGSYVYGEINTTTGKPIWSKAFYINDTLTGGKIPFLVLTDINLLNNKIYLLGQFQIRYNKVGSGYLDDTVIIHKDTFFTPCGFVLVCDQQGNYEKGVKFKMPPGSNYMNFTGITHDGEFLYIGGEFTDSLSWFDTLQQIKYKGGNLKPSANFFIASLTQSLKPRWFFQPPIINPTTTYPGNRISFLYTKNGFLYIAAHYAYSIELNNTTLKSSTGGLAPLFFKMDYMGNVLWATNGAANTQPGSGYVLNLSGTNKSVYACGTFYDSISFDKWSAKKVGYIDGWITRLADFGIFRGDISSGPYCAGDTIIVPYTEKGDFASDNYFIAQLSNERGDFDKDFVELGRIKSQNSDTIIGIIPTIKIFSSKDYRIRVISTNPVIQTYYVRDSLRLLIYSRDKADPGGDVSICRGDTFKLSTFGGTKWTWSPKYRMDDSTLRQPRVWPDRDTIYQIIIADSSGCGATDTAFKRITIKPQPQLWGDTIFSKCQGGYAYPKLFTKLTDTSGYTMTWYINGKRYWEGDRFFYPDDQSVKFKVVLNDNCSPVQDTMDVRIQYLGSLKLVPMKDTSVCKGQEVILTAKGLGGDTANHKIKWYNKGTFIGDGSPKITISETDTFEAILTDNCSANAAKVLVRVSIYPNLKPPNPINFNDTLAYCGITPLKLKTGTKNNGESYLWMDLVQNKTLRFTDTISVSSKTKISVSVKNLCGEQRDSFEILSITKPKLNVDTLYEACESGTLNLASLSANNFEKYTWLEISPNPKLLGKDSSISILNPGTYFGKTENFCGTDSVKFKVVWYPKPTAKFYAPDVCEGNALSFTNSSSGAKKYVWSFGDGTIDTAKNPHHNFPETGSSSTYLVLLSARISKDCYDSVRQPVNVFGLSDPDFTYTINGKEVLFNPITNQTTFKYRWLFGDGDSSKLNNPTHRYPSGINSYQPCLFISNDDGCESSLCQTITTGTDGIVHMSSNGFKIYPNPTEGIIHIESAYLTSYHIEIFDFTGKKVYSRNANQKYETIDLSEKSRGVYLLKIADFGKTSLQTTILLR